MSEDPRHSDLAAVRRLHFPEHSADASEIARAVLEEPWPVLELYDGPSDVRWLEELERALGVVARAAATGGLSEAAQWRLSKEIEDGKWAGQRRRKKPDPFDPEFRKYRAYLDAVGRPALQSLAGVVRHAEVLLSAARETRTAIGRSSRSRRSLKHLNIEAIWAVERARELWEHLSGKPAPTREPSFGKQPGAFGAFFADLHNALGVAGSPVSAFRVWAREFGEAAELAREGLSIVWDSDDEPD